MWGILCWALCFVLLNFKCFLFYLFIVINAFGFVDEGIDVGTEWKGDTHCSVTTLNWVIWCNYYEMLIKYINLSFCLSIWGMFELLFCSFSTCEMTNKWLSHISIISHNVLCRFLYEDNIWFASFIKHIYDDIKLLFF